MISNPSTKTIGGNFSATGWHCYLKCPVNMFSPRGLRLDVSSTAWFVVSKPRIVFGLLAVNPLLLTVIAIVHWNRKRLPEQRVDLYDECVDVLLGQRKEAEHVQLGRQDWRVR